MRQAGIYPDVDIEVYHKEEGISSTGVSLLLDCPARYYHKYHVTQPEAKEQKEFSVGRALHMYALEPDKFAMHFECMTEEVDLRTKQGRELYAETKAKAEGKHILRVEDTQKVVNMGNAIRKHPIWGKVGAGKAEQSVYWDDPIFGTRLRSRPDFFNDNVIVDIKTTESVKRFSQSIYSYGYHRQGAMQIDALHAIYGNDRPFILLVVEKTDPYLTACFTLDDLYIGQGRRDYQDACLTYNECVQTGVWPGYDTDVQMIRMPKWLAEKGANNE